jgi:hypothetical protein
MPREQVVRRLRGLGQPATLFGEDDGLRYLRLRRAQRDLQVADELLGAENEGQNTRLHAQRQQEKADKGKKGEAGKGKGTGKDKVGGSGPGRGGAGRGGAGRGGAGRGGAGRGGAGRGGAGAALRRQPAAHCEAPRDRRRRVCPPGCLAASQDKAAEPQDPLAAAFEASSKALAEKLAEEKMPLDDRISKYIARWTEDWEQVGGAAAAGRARAEGPPCCCG